MASGSEGQHFAYTPGTPSTSPPGGGTTPLPGHAGSKPLHRGDAREQTGDHKSQQQANCKGEVNAGCTAAPKEDEKHSKLRSDTINRLKKEKNYPESIKGEDFKAWQEKVSHDLAGSDAIAVAPIEPQTRQERITNIDKSIFEYQSGKQIYALGDNVYNATVGTVLGAWDFVKRLGKAIGEGSAAGKLMQSPDPRLQAEGQRLAQESGQDLKALAKGIIYTPVTIAKQASDGDWGTGVGALLGPKALGLAGGASNSPAANSALPAKVSEPLTRPLLKLRTKLRRLTSRLRHRQSP
ncbi:hypothetical protein [Methylobacterium brachiatum]|uniref:hypothetical protein n=1 Tax=Methylobacterium brachiatum TaxID=269660 RepID=UPI0008E141BE|nr:hypothetical protein [Methylobacterium brachiatum]SFJ78202.1 hypothetical protein SAMN02799642_05496 [Methylobacterium brachiatum]